MCMKLKVGHDAKDLAYYCLLVSVIIVDQILINRLPTKEVVEANPWWYDCT